jgi:hypothetical protein
MYSWVEIAFIDSRVCLRYAIVAEETVEVKKKSTSFYNSSWNLE